MINRITMKNCATYDSHGITIDNCRKINFIYGPNGSGKSTIGNYLSNLDVDEFNDCSIDLDGEYEILVYNKAFRDKHLNNTELPGVFTIGNATIEKLKDIDKLKSELESLKKERANLKCTLEKKKIEQEELKSEFENKLWNNIYKKYENKVQKVFLKYSNSKKKFAQHLLEIFRGGNLRLHEMEALLEDYRTLYLQDTTEPIELFPIIDSSIIESIKAVEGSDIWLKIIVGAQDLPISKIIQQLGNSDWVRAGIKMIHNDVCPFCQNKTITDEFKSQLLQFFGEEYEVDLKALDKLKQQYVECIYTIKRVFADVENAQKSIDVSRLNLDKFIVEREALLNKFKSNLQLIDNKLLEPSRKIDLNLCSTNIDAVLEIIKDANRSIINYNNVIKDIKTSRQKLNLAFWEFFVLENEEIIKDYNTKSQNISKSIQCITSKIGEYNDKINLYEAKIVYENQNVTSVQPTIDKINRLLHSYGFDGFTIVPSSENKNCYMIQRNDGTLVRSTLSEGEATFITFLYFIEMCNGGLSADGVDKNKIVILDDPISSLDSTVLFIVSTIIKDIKEQMIHNNNTSIKQLIVMTHNVYFHKEVSINYKDYKDNVHFWILRKFDNVSNLKDCNDDNPIKTTYQLLWDQIKGNEISNCVVIKNCMRRILENYFSFTGAKWDKIITDKFETIEEKIVVRSLVCWADEGSHDISDDIDIGGLYEDVDLYKSVFRQIFIKSNNEEHYKMMMGESN